jgi:hypothetical protein
MRLIDADALIPMMKYTTTDNEIGVFPIRIGFDAIKRVIDDAPTIDAVEVVRCKDCKHYSVEGETTRFGWCGYWNKPTDEMRYCSDGERREP